MNNLSNRGVSAWQYVGPAVLKALSRVPEFTPPQMVALVAVGVNPGILGESLKNDSTRELGRVFAECYAAKPDLTLRVVSIIREKWNAQSVAARVRKHLLTIAHHPAKDAALRADVFLKESVELVTVRRGRERIRPLLGNLYATPALGNALNELRDLGYYTGWHRRDN